MNDAAPSRVTASSKATKPSKVSGLSKTKTTSAAAPPKVQPIPADIQALGPLSVGHPHAGFLLNAVKLPSSDDWVITVPAHGFGTQETVDALGLCIGKVRDAIPNSAKVMLGSLSAERGGLLPPHKSHRTGRDVDVYFFRHEGAQWSKAATQEDLDVKRTWALLRCFATETSVEMILIDQKVQRWLEAYALALGEDPEWIQALFHDQGTNKTALVRHVPGHVAHMHVRFVSPRARRAAVQNYDRLVQAGVVVPPLLAVQHEVQRGDTLGSLAARYRLTVAKIQELNQLKTTTIRLGQRLTLQAAVDIRGARDPVYGRSVPKPRWLAKEAVLSPSPTMASSAAPSTVEAPVLETARPPGPPPVATTESVPATAEPRSP